MLDTEFTNTPYNSTGYCAVFPTINPALSTARAVQYCTSARTGKVAIHARIGNPIACCRRTHDEAGDYGENRGLSLSRSARFMRPNYECEYEESYFAISTSLLVRGTGPLLTVSYLTAVIRPHMCT